MRESEIQRFVDLFTVMAATITSASFWESIEYCAMVGVTIGVIGEYIAEFTKVSKSDLWKPRVNKGATLLLILALSVELAATVRANGINNRTIADLQNQAEQATKLAGQLGVSVGSLADFVKQKSGKIDAAISSLNAATESAQSRVSALASHVAGRRLSPKQIRDLIAALAPYNGQNIEVSCILGDPESQLFADDFYAVFHAAHWNDGGGIQQNSYDNVPIGIEITLNKTEVEAGRIPVATKVLVDVLFKEHLIKTRTIFKHPKTPNGIIEFRIGKQPSD